MNRAALGAGVEVGVGVGVEGSAFRFGGEGSWCDVVRSWVSSTKWWEVECEIYNFDDEMRVGRGDGIGSDCSPLYTLAGDIHGHSLRILPRRTELDCRSLSNNIWCLYSGLSLGPNPKRAYYLGSIPLYTVQRLQSKSPMLVQCAQPQGKQSRWVQLVGVCSGSLTLTR